MGWDALHATTPVHDGDFIKDEYYNAYKMYQRPNEFSNWERRLVKVWRGDVVRLAAIKHSIVNRHMADRVQNQDLWKRACIKRMFALSFWMKHGICRAEHERARPLFGDLPERFWASRYVNSDAPQIRIKILPRLKKEHRGKALGPSKLRYSYVPEAESTTAFEGTPAKVPCVSTSPSTSLGSVGTVSSRSDDEAYVGQTYVEETNTDKFPYTMANLPEIPDEDDDVQSMRLSAYYPVTYKRDRFYQCSEALRSDTLAAELSMLVCDVAY
ncbi:hypothetical protein C8Q72DRAFT_889919 [Fomitopsis betulina]|nr:hypothetical protein C8Q72DRAFT_889919 [Fomitopsis betulina]